MERLHKKPRVWLYSAQLVISIKLSTILKSVINDPKSCFYIFLVFLFPYVRIFIIIQIVMWEVSNIKWILWRRISDSVMLMHMDWLTMDLFSRNRKLEDFEMDQFLQRIFLIALILASSEILETQKRTR